MSVLVWRIDTGDIKGALAIPTMPILRHDLQTPDRYERGTACLIAEEVADTALKLMDSENPIEPELITHTLALTEKQDMFDQVRCCSKPRDSACWKAGPIGRGHRAAEAST